MEETPIQIVGSQSKNYIWIFVIVVVLIFLVVGLTIFYLRRAGNSVTSFGSVRVSCEIDPMTRLTSSSCL